MKCPKCGYQRKPIDTSPDWQCPSCGIAYGKFAQQQSSSAAEIKSKSPVLEIESPEFESADPGTVRLWGAIKLALGSALAYGAGVFLWKNFTGPGVLFIPLSFALIAAGGMVELIAGISILRIVKAWNEFEQTQAAKNIKYALFAMCILALLYFMKYGRPD